MPLDGEVVVRLGLDFGDGAPVNGDHARALVVVHGHAASGVDEGAVEALRGELGADLFHVLVGGHKDLDHPAGRGADLEVGLPPLTGEAAEVKELADTAGSEAGLALEGDHAVLGDASATMQWG